MGPTARSKCLLPSSRPASVSLIDEVPCLPLRTGPRMPGFATPWASRSYRRPGPGRTRPGRSRRAGSSRGCRSGRRRRSRPRRAGRRSARSRGSSRPSAGRAGPAWSRPTPGPSSRCCSAWAAGRGPAARWPGWSSSEGRAAWRRWRARRAAAAGLRQPWPARSWRAGRCSCPGAGGYGAACLQAPRTEIASLPRPWWSRRYLARENSASPGGMNAGQSVGATA